MERSDEDPAAASGPKDASAGRVGAPHAKPFPKPHILLLNERTGRTGELSASRKKIRAK
jgi:hypothetical protein